MSKDARNLKRIKIGSSSGSSDINPRKRYRVKIEGAWYEGQFSKQWFGWQFDDYRQGIQLNLIDEVYEMPQTPKARRFATSKSRPPVPKPNTD